MKRTKAFFMEHHLKLHRYRASANLLVRLALFLHAHSITRWFEAWIRRFTFQEHLGLNLLVLMCMCEPSTQFSSQMYFYRSILCICLNDDFMHILWCTTNCLNGVIENGSADILKCLNSSNAFTFTHFSSTNIVMILYFCSRYKSYDAIINHKMQRFKIPYDQMHVSVLSLNTSWEYVLH